MSMLRTTRRNLSLPGVVAALARTIALMSEIDETINKHGGWPVK